MGQQRKFSISREWGQGSFKHICLESSGCRFRKQGYCIMCDYGAGNMINEEQSIGALEKALNNRVDPVTNLLIGTCGSIFDEDELQPNVLKAILEYLKHKDINRIIFETHYSTVTASILAQLTNMLPNKHIAIELGFESSNQAVLDKCLKKKINLEQLKETIKLIKSHGMEVILDVFLGAPYLTTKEQLYDSINSVEWAYKNGADEIVIFPANIKPGTILWDNYKKGLYQPVSHWLLIELLSRLKDEELGIAAVSWFGDRQAAGVDTDIIPPEACTECTPKLLNFYSNFMKSFNFKYRKDLLVNLVNQSTCSCRKTLLRKLC